MKQTVALLLSLLTVFFVSWAIKANVKVSRPDNIDDGTDTAWYDGNYSTPVANSDFKLDSRIPDNYIPVAGEDDLYMYIDSETGKILGYYRVTETTDGKLKFTKVNPDIPDNYELVSGTDNIYKVTSKDGKVSYVKYIRNEDDTFAFVPCTKDGKPIDTTTGHNDATKVDKKHYIHDSGNTYKYYDENGVFAGYRERVKDNTGKYVWTEGQAPNYKVNLGNKTNPSNTDTGNVDVNGGSNKTIQQNNNGTYTETETLTQVKTQNGYKIYYQTKVIRVYNATTKELVSSSQQGPYEVKRVKLSGAEASVDKSEIASTLNGEVARVSKYVIYDTDKSAKLVAYINAQRTSAGVGTLKNDTSSDLYKLAQLRAADMAMYNHSSSSSKLYGTIEQEAVMFDVAVNTIYENVLKTPTKDAKSINVRFITDEKALSNITSSKVTSVAVAVVTKDGTDYIAEVFAS